jgi:hypothetical protein
LIGTIMPSALRQTVRVSIDHSIVVRHQDWNPGEEMEVLIRTKAAQSPAYTFLDVLNHATLETPEDYSTSYEHVLKGDGA